MINHFNFGECVCQSVRHCLCVRAFLSPQTEGAGSHRQKSVLIEADLQRPTSVSYRNGTEFFQRRMLNEMWFEVMWPHNISTQQLLHTTPTVCLFACQNNTTADKPPSAPLDRVIRDGQVSKRSQSLRILSCSSRINAILVSHWCRASSSSCLRGQERNNWQLFKDFLPGVPPPRLRYVSRSESVGSPLDPTPSERHWRVFLYTSTDPVC